MELVQHFLLRLIDAFTYAGTTALAVLGLCVLAIVAYHYIAGRES